MRKVFLDDLPRKKWNGTVCIDWKNSIGYVIKFIYNDIEGSFNIIDYKTNNIKINYLELEIWINTEEFKICKFNKIFNNIVIKDPWMIQYFQGGYDEAKKYTCKSNKKIYPICPDCGLISEKPISISNIYKRKRNGCVCGDGISYPNKFTYNMLSQLNISFIPEYSPDWIKPKRYDFYFELENKKYIIEMDGGIGHGNYIIDKERFSIEETLQMDSFKENLANIHGINVIRIESEPSDYETIKNNILNSELSYIFNLDIVNFNMCDKYAVKNITKIVCEYKKDNDFSTTSEMMKYFQLSRGTIIKYLKTGNRVGWCNYDAKEEIKKSNSKNGLKHGKKVEILKDGLSLGVFQSCHDLDRNSMSLFGVKLIYSNISEVCRGLKASYKGYVFRYVI